MHAPIRSLLVSLVALAPLAGCTVDLGECDPTEAYALVYFRDPSDRANPRNGVPLYAGQASMQQSCGDGAFCHSPSALGSERYGAPFGMNFDVSLACTTGECSDAELARLADDRHRVYSRRHAIYEVVSRGRMPPGARGASVVASAGEYVYIDADELLRCGSACSVQDGLTVKRQVMPTLATPEGRDILRNWLSCGSPLVEATEDPTSTPPSLPCGDVRGSVGECVVRVSSDIQPPDPSWPSIYASIVEPLCGRACHGPGPLDLRSDSMLDLSSQDTAYTALVGEAAKGSGCAGLGTLVIPGDSAGSLLIDKLGPEPPCGDPMPPTTVLLPDGVVAAIAEWIDAGAPPN